MKIVIYFSLGFHTGETFSRQKRTSSTFLTVHYFNSFVPIAQQAGQAVVQGRLPLNLSLVLHLPCMPSV
jgi:hypothetical protein